LLKGQFASEPREYLFVAIDDFPWSCLYAEIFPDKTQHSAACFLLSTAAQCPYQIDYAYSDNGKELKELTLMLSSKLAGIRYRAEVCPH